MKAIITAAFLIFGFCVSQVFGTEKPPLFTWDLLWAGFWYKSLNIPDGEFPPAEDIFDGGTLYNRGNFTLGFSGLDSSLRFLVTDKRLLPLVENDTRAGFNPGIGLYHHGSGSRLLYGVQNYFGLPARINNIWLRSVPYVESRQPSSRDLKLEPAARDESDFHLYLGLPYNVLPGFDVFASANLDSEQNLSLGGGMGWNALGPVIRLEGFYTGKELAPRNSSTWFSSTPPLPERDFNIYALSLLFHSPQAAFATLGLVRNIILG